MRDFDVAIVGAGHAGAHAAILLRQSGFEGSVGLIGAEPELPYERPPLSKDYLAGDKAFERMLIRPPAFWAERDIAVVTGTRIAGVDPEAKTLAGEAGERFGYRALVWAAGGVPRRLSCGGADLAGVHVVRCRAEVDAIAGELAAATRVAVIGGGYIGLETAAVLRKLGKQVVLVEAMDRLLSRVAGEPVGRFYEAEHRRNGVDVRLSAAVAAIEGSAGRASGLRLADGGRIAADLVIVGIGIDPADGPLRAAGAACGNGVHVDAFCRTSLPHIYAVGDCAAHENPYAGGARIRIESVQNANDMAACAVKAVLGAPEPYRATPWFWSNQYDLKLQTVGLSHGADSSVLRGDPSGRSFSLVYLRGGRVVALDCINAVKDYVQGRKLIEAGATPDPTMLSDSTIPLKDLA